MDPIMPPPEDWEALVPRPAGVCHERGGDARLLLCAGYALLLQVSHPVVGAGVSEHSRFREDPWGRLLRTLDYSYTMVYGGPRAAGEMGRRIRAMHRTIAGTTPAGARYRALEPEPYAWVHATLAEGIVTGHERFGRELCASERERFWAEWRTLGRLLGVRERDLPADWAGFRAYFEEMVAERLQRTAAVEEVLLALSRPPPPALRALGGIAWGAVRAPLGRVLELVTVGLLPPVLRERFGVSLSLAQSAQLGALSRALRASSPLLPPWLRSGGPAYLRWRSAEIAAASALSV